MSKRSFTLAALVPDPITINFEEKTYRGRNADELSTVDAIKLGWMQDELNELQAQLGNPEAIAAMTKEEQIGLAQSVESLADQMIQIIVPDITDEEVKRASFVLKVGLLREWQIWQQEAQVGKPKAVRAGRVKPR